LKSAITNYYKLLRFTQALRGPENDYRKTYGCVPNPLPSHYRERLQENVRLCAGPFTFPLPRTTTGTLTYFTHDLPKPCGDPTHDLPTNEATYQVRRKPFPAIQGRKGSWYDWGYSEPVASTEPCSKSKPSHIRSIRPRRRVYAVFSLRFI